jgi:hypothetical protein
MLLLSRESGFDFMHLRRNPSLRFGLPALCALAFLTGCSEREPITRYTVNKPLPLEGLANANPHQAQPADAPPTGDPTDRTLGAIVPLAEQGWFFKLTGPKDAVAAQEANFGDFVKSLRFSPEGKPSWTLPDGWTEKPGSGIRHATLAIAGDKPLEVTVIVLPKSGDDAEYLLANINRWRGQLRLAPIEAQALASESSRVPLDGTAATVVNLVGHAAPNTMGGGGPFSSGARDGN